VAGDLFGASLALTTLQVVVPDGQLMWKLTDHVTREEISLGIGILGMPGSTAYGGLLDVLDGKNSEGQTIWVSAAAGAVGGMVGQLAKNVLNCTVIGSAGGPDKCRLLVEELGYDHAVDYRACGSKDELAAAIKSVAPDGIDMYFENVGGMHFEAAMDCLRTKGRVAICGRISQYNDAEAPGVRFDPGQMIYSFQRVEGFMCLPWLTRQKGNFVEDMAQWMHEGKIKVKETFYDGVESWPTAFRALFDGTNIGKVVVRV